MNPKDIENLYKEKLQDLSIAPEAAVWNKIEASLLAEKKQNRKVFFFWVGSAAAILLIGFLLFKPSNYTTNFYTLKENQPIDSITTLDSKKLPITNTSKLENIDSQTNTIATNKTQITKTETVVKNTVVKIKKQAINTQKNTINKVAHQKTEPQQKEPVLLTVASNKINQKTPTKEKAILPQKELATTLEEETITTNIHQNKKWSVAPTISQYYYGALSNKSTIDSRLNSAKKEGQTSTAYGVTLAYQASNKIRIKTGLHRINLSQITSGQLVTTLNRFSRFSYSNNQTLKNQISLQDGINRSFINNKEIIKNNQTQLNQNIGYLEIPLEVNYNIYENNKFQLHLLGGFSTLFLTNNQIEIKETNYSYTNGSATNLNKLNFSFNIGTDVEYHFAKQWFFNLSPIFKIQTQTFQKANNTPYVLGVSSGLHYKF